MCVPLGGVSAVGIMVRGCAGAGMREEQGAGSVLVFVLCACMCALSVGSGCVTEALCGVVRPRAGVVCMCGPVVGPMGAGSRAVCQQIAADVHCAQHNVQHRCTTGFLGST